MIVLGVISKNQAKIHLGNFFLSRIQIMNKKYLKNAILDMQKHEKIYIAFFQIQNVLYIYRKGKSKC